MKSSKALWLLVLIAGFAGCQAGDQHSSSRSGSDTTQKAANSDIAALCNPRCEEVAYSKRMDANDFRPVGLRPAEAASLGAALSSTDVSGDPDKIHIHADAIKDQLVFLPDGRNDPTRESHVSGSEISIRNPKTGPSAGVKVVATPAALQLLGQREAQRVPSQ